MQALSGGIMQPATSSSGNRTFELCPECRDSFPESRMEHEARMMEFINLGRAVSDEQWHQIVIADQNERNQPLITMDPLIWKALFEQKIVNICQHIGFINNNIDYILI